MDQMIIHAQKPSPNNLWEQTEAALDSLMGISAFQLPSPLDYNKTV